MSPGSSKMDWSGGSAIAFAPDDATNAWTMKAAIRTSAAA
jgi:hypothetical protein